MSRWILQVLLVLAIIGAGAVAGLRILNLEPAAVATAEESEGDEHAGGHEEASENDEGHSEDATRIDPQTAKAAGIEIAEAGPAQIRETLILQGMVEYDVRRVRRAMARYPGVILSMSASIGKRVEAGDVLAEVESDDSLQTYAIRAPIDGIVTQQLANVGETTVGRDLYVIADLSQVWVDLAVFRGDQARVQVGQWVRVWSLDEQLEATGKIGYITPISSALSQSTTARIFLDNPKSIWQPGMAVTGEVVVAEEKVPLAVRNSALQSFEGSEVVFIREREDTYEPRALELGRTDGEHTEVLDGLAPGTEYVAENSYLVKADIEKSGASHDH